MIEIRIDKFLWAVRLYKTRSLATEACKKGKVQLNDANVKSSKIISINDIISVSRPPIVRQYEVISLLKNRIGAKLVGDYIKDITPEAELEKLEQIKMSSVDYYRPKGTGRATKKDRRLLGEMWD